jgi:hypothetical protein
MLALNSAEFAPWYRFGTGCIVRCVQSVQGRGHIGQVGRSGTDLHQSPVGWGPKGRWFKSSRPDFHGSRYCGADPAHHRDSELALAFRAMRKLESERCARGSDSRTGDRCKLVDQLPLPGEQQTSGAFWIGRVRRATFGRASLVLVIGGRRKRATGRPSFMAVQSSSRAYSRSPAGTRIQHAAGARVRDLRSPGCSRRDP